MECSSAAKHRSTTRPQRAAGPTARDESISLSPLMHVLNKT
jgi:hypothetical protein